MSYPVPYSTPLPFALGDGKEIVVLGVPHHHANGFLVSLSVGRDHNAETPFVFNPRFTQNEVVRNHNRYGWGNEEKHGGFPFYKGVPYEIKIITRGHGFQVLVNNSYFCDFNHRLPKESVRNLYIEGETSVNRVAFVDVVHNPFVPFIAPIHGGVFPGRIFTVNGVPNGVSRFNINLLVGGGSLDYNDVALTFDVRFNYGNDRNQVIRNHKSGGGWGTEERHQNFFPFIANVPFEVTILAEAHGFKVAVNNQHFIEFRHRVLPVERISHLSVEGDVRLTQVRV